MAASRPRVVFVAGSSYSGSTMFGLVLGSDPRAFFVGEPKQIARATGRDPPGGKDRRVCTCGEFAGRCAFWSTVRRHYRSNEDLNSDPGLSRANVRLLLRILSPRRLRWRPREGTAYASLLEAIAKVAQVEKPGVEFVVDGSKSLSSLDALACSPDLDLVVVHLVRDCAAVADSYKDRGFSPLYGGFAWGVVNVLLRFYVWRRGIPVLTVGYEAFCRSPERELARVNRFLGTTLSTDEVPAAVRREPYHLFSGNDRVRGRIREFAGIERHPDRVHLGRFERLAATGVGQLVRRLLRFHDPA